MPLPGFARTAVTVIRAAKVVDRGAEVPDWDHPVTHVIGGCSWQPGVGLDDQTHRQAVGMPGQLFLPAGADVTGLDRVVLDGDTYEVVGHIERWDGPTPYTSHTVANLHLWEG